MSDTKPLPDDPDRTVAAPATPDPAPADPIPGEPVRAAEPAAEPAPQPAPQPAASAYPAGPAPRRPVGGRLRDSRVWVPLLVGLATLVLGCCLGAGLVAAGVAVFGDGHRGDDRGRITRDDRDPRGPRGPAGRNGDVRPGDGRNRLRPGQPGNRPPTPAPTATPTPSAS